MRVALLVAVHEVRRRLRDRSALVLAVVAPLALASILGAAFSGLDDDDLQVRVALADADRSPTSQTLGEVALVGAGELADVVTVEEVDGADRARRLVGRRVAVAVAVPAGFEASLARPGPAPDVQVWTDPDDPIASELVRSLVQGWLARVRAGRVAAAAVTAGAPLGTPLPPAAVAEVARRAAAAEPAATLRDGGVEQDVNLAAYFGPSMGILFLFFALGLMARSLLAERRDGTLARLQAAPVGFGPVMLGKAAAVGAVGTASLLLLWAATSVLFGASWGSPLPVVLLILATVLAVGGIASMIASVARTEAQAEGITSVTAFLLGLLGGNFFPINQLPDSFLRLSRFTPNGVALQAFADLSFQRAALGEITGALLTLVTLGAATAAIAGVRLRRGVA